MARRAREGAGFTLVEVLVAFAIAALGLAALFQIFATGLRSAAISEGYARATMLAESQLDRVGIEQPLAPGERFGVFDDGYRWHVAIAPYQEAEMDALVEIFEVSVTVSWGEESGGGRAVTLRTLRLGSER